MSFVRIFEPKISAASLRLPQGILSQKDAKNQRLKSLFLDYDECNNEQPTPRNEVLE